MLYPIKEQARSLCRKSEHPAFHHGAIVFNKGKPIGQGWNGTQTNGRLYQKYGYKSTHAECAALKNVDKADTILVVRIRREDNELSCSKPCPKCMKFLKDKGIKKIFFSNWSGEIENMRL